MQPWGVTPPAKKMKAPTGPSVLGNPQEALERISGLLCDKDLMAEMSFQAVGEQMLVELAMAVARGCYLTSQSDSLGKQVVTLTDANMKLTKQGALMNEEHQKLTGERDTALTSKRGLEEEKDVAVATARSLEQKISKLDKEVEKHKAMSMGMSEKVKNACREAIELFLQSPEYH
ncbi:hypothetical protein RHMOL_Rhmol11G0001900 [Rhododendron molle]|uniref:Uncharacterized protein n=1 Tax=Rhododendron molle TaxID=49168 RepID=A0ACC0LMF4_RHOML|nr:hypothetical protein RHMOL_Rhmol11G0001900 [Rhododendron molle]